MSISPPTRDRDDTKQREEIYFVSQKRFITTEGILRLCMYKLKITHNFTYIIRKVVEREEGGGGSALILRETEKESTLIEMSHQKSEGEEVNQEIRQEDNVTVEFDFRKNYTHKSCRRLSI